MTDQDHSPPRGGFPAVRARTIKAKNVAGVQILGADAETAAKLADAGIPGEIVADDIDAENVAGVQIQGRSEVESLDQLRAEVAILKQTIEQLSAAAGAGASAEVEEAVAELETAAKELAEPNPAAGAIVPKLERATEILDKSAKTAAAADKLGSSLAKLVPAARAAWHAASTWFGV